MKDLRICICDFWVKIDEEMLKNNVIYQILLKHFNIIFDEINPELVIYSVFGSKNKKYNCKKIKIVEESNFHDKCVKYEIGMDYNESLTNDNYFYIPCFFLNNDCVSKYISNREKYMCFLVSNRSSQERLDVFNYLNKIKKVDSGGVVCNNIGYCIPRNKTNDFFRNYKFSISYENLRRPGYLTEKLFISLINGCIPIYCGDDLVTNIVNENCFINANKLTQKEILEKINQIDASEELYNKMLREPVLKDRNYIDNLYTNLEKYLLRVINE